MSCFEIDLNDYFFGEAPEAEAHVAGCAECSAGLDQLRATRAALLTLREEEPPQRIGFVSDKIFEPSPLRRFFATFWLSGARLGFASAAMLSVALLVLSARTERPRVIERTVQVAAQPVDVDAAVAKAVKAAMLEQDKKTRLLLEASDRKHRLQEGDLAMRVADYTTNLEKDYMTKYKILSYNREEAQPR